ETKLRAKTLSRRQFAALDEQDSGGKIAAAVMDSHERSILQRPGGAAFAVDQSRGFLQRYVQCFAGSAELRQRDHLASADPARVAHRLNVGVGEVQRSACSRSAYFHVAVMILETSDARRLAARLNDDRLPAPKRSTDERARNDRANSAQRECAIDRQTWFGNIARRPCVRQDGSKR